MSTTPRFGIETWDEGNTEPNLVFNELAYTADAMMQATVLDKDLATPPSSPALGDMYIVAASPTGSWTGHAKDLALAVTGGWLFYTPSKGWQVYVIDEDAIYIYSGTAWGPGGSGLTHETAAIQVACSDETTVLTTGTAKATFRAPYAFTLVDVRASLTTPASSGTVTVDVNMSGSSVLSTPITIDATEGTSTTAATPPVISTSAITDDAEITIDLDGVGAGATGLKVLLRGTIP